MPSDPPIRSLPRPLHAYRIGDPAGRHPIWSDGGARRTAGRWHQAGAPVIYASEHYATAMLEKLVHFAGILPQNQHFIQITLPQGLTYQVANPDLLPGWHDPESRAARQCGIDWLTQGTAAVLIVPSVVARMERNFVFNTQHPQFALIDTGLETPIRWDDRLFQP